MSLQDPIADMLTSIRNAQSAGIRKVRVPFSKFKMNILAVLKQEGFIEEFEETNTDNKRNINISLKYYQGRPVIEKINRVSRPALRVYKGHDEIPLVRGGLGISIISTPKGVITDKTARSQHVGGEVLCTVE